MGRGEGWVAALDQEAGWAAAATRPSARSRVPPNQAMDPTKGRGNTGVPSRARRARPLAAHRQGVGPLGRSVEAAMAPYVTQELCHTAMGQMEGKRLGLHKPTDGGPSLFDGGALT